MLYHGIDIKRFFEVRFPDSSNNRGVDCLYILVPVRLLVDEHIFDGK
jgi:hypothetical protein